jgi:hypothetical protein
MVAQPHILILDEATSAVDPHKRNVIQHALKSCLPAHCLSWRRLDRPARGSNPRLEPARLSSTRRPARPDGHYVRLRRIRAAITRLGNLIVV